MNFNKHYNLEGKHAFLGASKYHWLNYDEDKLITTYKNFAAVQRGTELHDLARHLIELGVNLPRTNKTLNMFVNDAIGYLMTPEQALYYSENCFGTADAISFRKNSLRIHDLKTGETPASMKQLEIYAALFCLEYDKRPSDISIELRLYQNNQALIEKPTAEVIVPIMDKIITFDKILTQLRAEEG